MIQCDRNVGICLMPNIKHKNCLKATQQNYLRGISRMLVLILTASGKSFSRNSRAGQKSRRSRNKPFRAAQKNILYL